MPISIVLDTNYLRGLGVNSYPQGELPSELTRQLSLAEQRGDLVIVPGTVVIELDAWLATVTKNNFESLREAVKTIQQAGLSIREKIPDEPKPPQFAPILKKHFPKAYIFQPELEDYREAERRTSGRLPPLPKDPNGEEFRDRIIWVQCLRYVKESNQRLLIVSGDTIFKNGAASEEGRKSNIHVAAGASEFDQYLGERSAQVLELIDQITLLSKSFTDPPFPLTDQDISAIEDIRSVVDSNGALIRSFSIIGSANGTLPDRTLGSLTLIGGTPMSLLLALPDGSKIASPPPKSTENIRESFVRHINFGVEAQRRKDELKRILEQ